MRKFLMLFLLATAPCVAFDYSPITRAGGFFFSGQKGKSGYLLKPVQLQGQFLKCQCGWSTYPDELNADFLNGSEIETNLFLKDWRDDHFAIHKLSDLYRPGEDGYIYIPRKDWEKAKGFELKVITK